MYVDDMAPNVTKSSSSSVWPTLDSQPLAILRSGCYSRVITVKPLI